MKGGGFLETKRHHYILTKNTLCWIIWIQHLMLNKIYIILLFTEIARISSTIILYILLNLNSNWGGFYFPKIFFYIEHILFILSPIQDCTLRIKNLNVSKNWTIILYIYNNIRKIFKPNYLNSYKLKKHTNKKLLGLRNTLTIPPIACAHEKCDSWKIPSPKLYISMLP